MSDGRPKTEDGDMNWVDASWFAGWRQGKVWVTSDLHVGHERIIELCSRPYGSVGEMNDGLLDGINSVVKSRDTLVVAGDIVMGKLEVTMRLLRRIRAGRIWLLPGNHDRFSLAFKHGGSVEIRRSKRALWQTQYEGIWSDSQGRPRTVSGVRSVRVETDQVPSAWRVPLAGREVMMSHYPYVGDSYELKKDRYQELRPVDTGMPLVHGHVHGSWATRGRMFNVGVDVRDFKPVSEDEIAGWLAGLPGLPETARVGDV